MVRRGWRDYWGTSERNADMEKNDKREEVD
jgi:hypothetical protein